MAFSAGPAREAPDPRPLPGRRSSTNIARQAMCEIRAFLGGRKAGDRCLYVSTGGFTRDAKYEVDRSSTPLTLLTLPQLRELLLDHYEKLDSEIRMRVP
jgi:predicted Mrr-cat superfamily restriction endonuclease